MTRTHTYDVSGHSPTCVAAAQVSVIEACDADKVATVWDTDVEMIPAWGMSVPAVAAMWLTEGTLDCWCDN
jgi:hypothetical protein